MKWGMCCSPLFQKNEIKKVIFSMRSESAPGPNGFGVQFFKSFWEVIKPDLMLMFDDWFKGGLDLKRLSYGVITLLPKVKEANNIRQYRPICLVNVDYKIFTKTLTNRIGDMAKDILDQAQTAFTKGRSILEGVAVLHEVIHELRRKKLRGLIMKIDFEKAYDNVNWSFLEEVLTHKVFPVQWVKWVKQSVQGGKVCVNVNGQRSDFFKTFRGLRLGDPLSPFLFNLVANALGNLMNKAKARGLIQGLVQRLIPESISHIQYADDTVIMVDPTVENIRNLKIILYCFEFLSRLKINFHKSEAFLFGVQ